VLRNIGISLIRFAPEPLKKESPILRAEWEILAKSYVRLAEQSDETEQLDLIDDPILGLLGASRH
jgi:hypothetical protein